MASIEAGFLNPKRFHSYSHIKRNTGLSAFKAEGNSKTLELQRIFFHMKENTTHGEWIGSYSVSTPEDSIPLQAGYSGLGAY